MNLIEKLGLEKCKRIVDGAPEYSYAVVPCADGEMYFAQREDGKWFRYRLTNLFGLYFLLRFFILLPAHF